MAELPEKTPVQTPASDGQMSVEQQPSVVDKKKQKRQKRQKLAEKLITVAEQAVGEPRDALLKKLEATDTRVEAAMVWRRAGAELQTQTKHHFAAMKHSRHRVGHMEAHDQLKADNQTFQLHPVKLDFSRKLFELSVATMIPSLAKARAKLSTEDASSFYALKRYPPLMKTPPKPDVDADEPGRCAFLKERREERREALAAQAADEVAEQETTTLQRRKKAQALEEAAKSEQQQQDDDELAWAELDDKAQAAYASVETVQVERHLQLVEECERNNSIPASKYKLTLHEPAMWENLMAIPQQIKTFEYLSPAGPQVQHAKLAESLVLHYVPSSEQLTIKCALENVAA